MASFLVKFPTANTGASTLDAGGGRLSLTRDDGTALQGGDIPAGTTCSVAFDAATNTFRVIEKVLSQFAGFAPLARPAFTGPVNLNQSGSSRTNGLAIRSSLDTNDGLFVYQNGLNNPTSIFENIWDTGGTPVYAPIAINPSGGYVGVGTSSPSYTLDVSGSARVAGNLIVGGSISGVPVVQGSFRNLKLSAAGTSNSVNVSFDELVLGDGSGGYTTDRSFSGTVADGSFYFDSAGSVSANYSYSSLTANTIYAIWRIAKTDGTKAWLVSTSQTAAALPSGFTLKAFIGMFKTDSSANRYPYGFTQFGRRVQWQVKASTNIPAWSTLAIASGVAGATVTPTLVSVSTTSWIPTSAGRGSFALYQSNNYSMISPNNALGQRCFVNGYNASGLLSPVEFNLETANTVYWASDGSAGALYVFGFELNI
jgi:hypothetical protein